MFSNFHSQLIQLKSSFFLISTIAQLSNRRSKLHSPFSINSCSDINCCLLTALPGWVFFWESERRNNNMIFMTFSYVLSIRQGFWVMTDSWWNPLMFQAGIPVNKRKESAKRNWIYGKPNRSTWGERSIKCSKKGLTKHGKLVNILPLNGLQEKSH